MIDITTYLLVYYTIMVLYELMFYIIYWRENVDAFENGIGDT
jgi:hypothetical protein